MKNRNLTHSNNWGTPPEFYAKLNEEFNFDFDPCPLNHDLSLWNGLIVDWGKRNYINPPYERKVKEAFVKRAIDQAFNRKKLCVLLLPVSTSTALFHDYILPNITSPIRFLRGRLKFIGVNTFGESVHDKCGMHDSMIVIFDGRTF